jgi:hypothetical protein
VEEDNYEEDSYVSDTSPLRGSEQAPDRRRVVPASAEEYSEAEYEHDEYGEIISGLNQLLPTPRQGAGFPPKKLFDPKQRGDLTKPCHIKYRGGDCDGSCGYSHSSEHMLERRDYFNRENVNSPYQKPEVKRAIAATMQPSQPPRLHYASSYNSETGVVSAPQPELGRPNSVDRPNSGDLNQYHDLDEEQNPSASSAFPGSS